MVHGVVAGRECDRRPKFLFSYATGAPSIKASFLERCALDKSLIALQLYQSHIIPSIHDNPISTTPIATCETC